MTHKSDNKRILILSPHANTLWNASQKRTLDRVAGEVIYIEKPQLLENISYLFDNKMPTILALDPDICDWNVDDNVLRKMKSIETICLQTTSFSWINVMRLRELNIRTTNIRNYATESVSEWAILMMLSLARRIPLVAKARWTENITAFEGIELSGKTVGVIGLGHIGTRIAEMCEGFGMTSSYWSRHTRNERFSYKPLPTLFKNADVVFLTLAKNKSTTSIITDTHINSMKKSAIFVSVVDEIYNHDLLVNKVKNNSLLGYGFEQNNGGVFDSYEGNIWAGPALAWNTREAKQRNAHIWLENIVHAVGGKYPNLVSV